MGRWQPYLYSAPERQSMNDTRDNFNPKAVTMASRMPPPPPKKKQDGPLVDFNKHPDSYLFLPYGKTDAKPMSARTKLWVNIARWTQLALRVCSLFGAAGLLLCAIFIRGAQDTEGWIMRIPPGVDMVACLYAIYHLIRSPKSRAPASSASYHFFALVTDAGFIPFYVYTLLLSRRNADLSAGTAGRWRTIFPTDDETDKILLTAWLTAITAAGLHLISAVLDIYLVVVFRKISKLPPDMNPLEDNLTRRKSKHKHKNSSMSVVTPFLDDEKRFSGQSSNSVDRNSQFDPLLSQDVPSPTKTQMSFMHTRSDSETAYSPHTPKSAQQSKERFSMYSQPQTARQSRTSLAHRDDLYRRDDNVDNETLAQRKSFLAQQANMQQNERNNSYVTSSSKQEFYTPPTTARSNQLASTGDLALEKSSREELRNDNWFIHADEDGEQGNDTRYLVPKQSKFAQKKGYTNVSSHDVSDVDETSPTMVPQPLRMNPPTPQPTPPPIPNHNGNNSTLPPSNLKRTQTTMSISTEATFNRSQSRGSTPKSRYYGDLKAATAGIRSGDSASNSPATSPTKGPSKIQPNQLPSATAQYTVNSSPVKNSLAQNAPFSLDKKSYTSVRKTGEFNHTPVKAISPRVVSRSGIDYVNPYEFDDSDLGVPGRKRDVSGKIAEEGRGGAWKDGGLTHRKASGVGYAF
ncbi:hypothetical protein C7974DRAFT_472292 [Boeremia exigua]|uniref:uncharacterized protein n=1 Tax=Boeremia exigua TaxID=749465 RepID=UPI001E8DB107|nr:uncharacterized protein C7974DRAFT_472292 [Boeremia exigua]KAH6629512.1 hypothetical protein C7974DRAFT_472292 [Boeremia exigua]